MSICFPAHEQIPCVHCLFIYLVVLYLYTSKGQEKERKCSFEHRNLTLYILKLQVRSGLLLIFSASIFLITDIYLLLPNEASVMVPFSAWAPMKHSWLC